MSLALVQDNVSAIPSFDDLWTLYPRRVCRKAAMQAWAKLTPRERVEALTALVAWRRVWLAKGDMDYVPHASTWLNGERWTDELPSHYSAASHVPAKPPESGERTEMPEHVRAAIAKLRAK